MHLAVTCTTFQFYISTIMVAGVVFIHPLLGEFQFYISTIMVTRATGGRTLFLISILHKYDYGEH